MNDPVAFDTATPRLGLPILFAGQAQKETFVNEALMRLDALVHAIVEDEAASPPADPAEGSAWLVANGASGVWAGQQGRIALRQSGQWLFAEPRDGMRIMHRTTGQDLRRLAGSWLRPQPPGLPTGGTVVDAEARATIAVLVEKLTQVGVFPAP